MFDKLREDILKFFTSRLTILTLLFLALGGILLYRCFDLQIVHGQEYLDNFILQTVKTRDISSSRGSILDRNGVVLAYDELAYSVRIEDVFESASGKNAKLNDIIYRLIKLIEKNGDSVSVDFSIILNEDNEFEFTVEGTKLQRFLADVYGKSLIDDLDDGQRASTARDIIDFLAGNSSNGFEIGGYAVDGDSSSGFVVGKGYTNEELLKMVAIRYNMKLTSYRKYIGTTVATDVNDMTAAAIMENSMDLSGVSIVEDTVRRYNDSVYFAHMLGYTGMPSSDEIEAYNARNLEEGGSGDRYTGNDMVGKSGIEAYMETTLQGTKGYEQVSVDNMGRVIEILDREEAQMGNDVVLTIDSELQKAAYNILEQGIAGILLDKIINAKEYVSSGSSSDIMIPIYDVYYAVINNSVIDINHFAEDTAGETEKEVYEAYLGYREKTYERLNSELKESPTTYNKLTLEYQVYESYIVEFLKTNGVLDESLIDNTDATQIAWAKDEVISLNEYLNYCIAQNWINVTMLNMNSQYSDSSEIYNKICEYIFEMIDNNLEFQKRIYRFMIKNDVISGKQICKILCEQNAIEVSEEDKEKLYNGSLSAYDFMINRISHLDLTPAQLALDPCSGSVVIVDCRTGDVLAMVSYPGYDNNMMANSVDAEYFASLRADKTSPLLNYATQYRAAPGSTFKMVSATAALMEGIIDLRTQIKCTGQFTEVTPSPWCWYHSGHGNLNVTGAIQNSCNYFFYDVGYMLSTRSGSYNAQEGLDTLAKYADMYGLTEKTGVEIDEYEPKVSDELPIPSAIGQGTNSFTTVGLARYVATVANGGTCYNLTLIDSVTDSDGTVLTENDAEVRNVVDMPEEYWDAIHLGMRKVVEGKSYFNNLSVAVAGKTGTAQQVTSRPNHALFLGYAPYDSPEIAFATRIPFGYSSDYAAQITRNIIAYYYGLADIDEIVTGEADTPDAGVSNNEI